MLITTPIHRYVLEKILKTTIRFPAKQGLAPETLRKMLAPAVKMFPVDDTLQFRTLELGGMRCEEIKKPKHSASQLIFHIHGGAFCLGGLDSHRGFMCDLVNATDMQVIHTDYPLAPEHTFPTALNRLYDAYLEILAQGILPKDITLSGDSAGGNLALALCLKLRDAKIDLPSSLVLLSPWLDLTLSGESMQYNAAQDVILSESFLRQSVERYVGDDASVDEAYVSPLFAQLEGLPDLLIQVGSKEILLDDAKRLKHYAEKAGVEVTLSIFPGMWHIFHLFNHWLPEGQEALTNIANFIKKVDE